MNKNRKWDMNNKDYYKKYNKLYYKRNKEKLAERNKEYLREMRIIAKEIGNCPSCFKERDNPKFKECSKCRTYFREYKYGKHKPRKRN